MRSEKGQGDVLIRLRVQYENARRHCNVRPFVMLYDVALFHAIHHRRQAAKQTLTRVV